jgi:hypothetical protein
MTLHNRVEILSPPCPHCKRSIKLMKHWRKRKADRECLRHFYRCPKRPKMVEPGRHETMEHYYQRYCKSVEPRDIWLDRCWEAIQAERAPLSALEIRIRQRMAGHHVTKAQRQLGGRNQKIEDKRRGGQMRAHRRWHTERGLFVKGCPLCRRYPRG